MRQKADKLEKGKWYSDHMSNHVTEVFLRFSHIDFEFNAEYFSEQNRLKYSAEIGGLIGFVLSDSPWYLPTPEDIEKYNLLNEEEQ